jgi:NAD(P)-dependent dehydrogenase (short-subunit alcohol dehydrogenase family)
MTDFEGSVAVVTGAASGIGAGLARAFAEQGARLVLADVELAPTEELADELRRRAQGVLALRCDVSDPDAIRELAERAYGEYGEVNVLCNNAGVCQGGPVHEMTPEDWQWLLSVNLLGVIHGCREFVPRMLIQPGSAHILNTASVGGFVSGGELGMYSTTKYAVVGYSEALAQDVARHGIGVSILCPGWTDTRLGDAARNRPAGLGSAPAKLDVIVPGMAAGMDPLEVGRRALRGIRERALYVFTHADLRPVVAQRFEAVLGAMDRAAEPPDESDGTGNQSR